MPYGPVILKQNKIALQSTRQLHLHEHSLLETEWVHMSRFRASVFTTITLPKVNKSATANHRYRRDCDLNILFSAEITVTEGSCGFQNSAH